MRLQGILSDSQPGIYLILSLTKLLPTVKL